MLSLPRTISRTVRPQLRAFSACRVARQDPWPLPHTPQHIAATATKEPDPDTIDLVPFPPLMRDGEGTEKMRARLVYQSRKRGTLESDLLLSTFARDYLKEMSAEDMREYDKLLDEPDWDIYYWATYGREPPAKWADSRILAKLREHAKNEGKETRSMPSL
ncbi:DUF339-domain-containing protein [Coniophora puteana RWD-64-598 SS2]|uniref:Succinate dehydrogenase assembly factor 2, mitochondrial n=1 Tax=Coniophora puteana (strain RWD-64-598) TaxID=741705 RepID=A0A5M3MGT9_CONPW|nr:DUF339-domain-containing protein [Coniophora puteana RWD-64-598 SS2]EIW77831.1 DUF339-domain-containing protein [Coniophora puteana RWD-64-598 SS2]